MQVREQYYGARAVARLRELVELVLHEGKRAARCGSGHRDGEGLRPDHRRSRDADTAEVFASLPGLKVG